MVKTHKPYSPESTIGINPHIADIPKLIIRKFNLFGDLASFPLHTVLITSLVLDLWSGKGIEER
jgi:hypothetical protein